MIGLGPPAVYVLAQSSAVSYAARATPTAAMPATGPGQAMPHLVDEVVGHTRRLPLDDDRREALRAASVRIRPDDHRAHVRPPGVPAGARRPVLAPVEHVVVAVPLGDHTDPGGAWQRDVEVRRSPGRAGRLTRGPAAQVLALWVGGRGPGEAVLLLI